MDMELRRRTWLRLLVTKAGTQADFHRANGVNQGMVSALLNGKKTFGERLARKLEKTLRIDEGYLDRPLRMAVGTLGDRPRFEELEIIYEAMGEAEADDDYATLPQLEASASMGIGTINNEFVEVKGGLKFKRTFLREEGMSETHGEIIYAKGDSMLPTIPGGSVVLVNRSELRARHGKVFLLLDKDDGLRIKRLKRAAAGWTIGSDNEDKLSHPDQPFDDALHEILGRAVWFGSRL